MKRIMSSSWAVINPRPVDDPIAMVTFPSKTFEYMMCGRPVISTRLNGFSSEYNDLIYFADMSEPNELANVIDHVAGISEEEISQKCNNAVNFIVNTHTWDKQTRRIIEFIKHY